MTNSLRDIGGDVLHPGDHRYDTTRMVWNAAIDRHPRVIVRAGSVQDVVTAIRVARDQDLEIGVRCGGHSAAGHAVPDGGLMIDLARLGQVRVDPAARRAWVGGGALLGALDRAAQGHGLATTAGNVSHTGVGGLTLGGGMGWLARRFGLACDNVVAYQLVTAEGRILRVTAEQHPDLFWALRGGGGNFGVVTEFEFALHRTGTQALTVEFDFPIERAAWVLRAWRDLAADAPRAATFTADIAGATLTVGYVWVGPPAAGRALVPAFGALGRPTATRIDVTSYLALQSRADTVGGHCFRRYGTGHYLPVLTDEAIEALVSAADQGPLTPYIGLQAYGGAIADVPDAASAFSHRDAAFEFGASTRWSDRTEDQDRIGVARAAAALLAPFARGAYVNALGEEGPSAIRRAYSPDKLARLTAIKDAYDPQNTFHHNHNIPPSANAGRGHLRIRGRHAHHDHLVRCRTRAHVAVTNHDG
jgi:FAD/FMN-containing dehydrogenase